LVVRLSAKGLVESLSSQILSIDGPAGSGKTTVTKHLAEKIKGASISSGLVYRVLAFILSEDLELAETIHNANDFTSAVKCLGFEFQNGCTIKNSKNQDITEIFYTKSIDQVSSQIAKKKENRMIVSGFLSSFIKESWVKDFDVIIIEGRDIGSVVFPDARWKIYLDASVEERVLRRNQERDGAGNDILKRDRSDRDRKNSPLVIPPGALIIDSTTLDLEGVIALILEHIS